MALDAIKTWRNFMKTASPQHFVERYLLRFEREAEAGPKRRQRNS
jgi:hypothetical protein